MNIASVIKYENENNNLVWKHPDTDFNTNSQLIVHETQEAIFFKDGVALDLFGPGKYTLTTENIPLLGKFLNLITNEVSSFHCEVYFVNKVDILNILWGTNSKIPVQDPIYNIILPVGANGQFGIKIEDSRKFLLKLVGTTNSFDQNKLIEYFRGLLLTKIKNYISTQMVVNKISFLDITTKLSDISFGIQKELKIDFENYGIELVNFFVNSIFIPEDDPSLIQLKNALAKKAELNILGFNYKEDRIFGVLDKAAANESTSGAIVGAGLGLGIGINTGNIISNAMGDGLQNTSKDTSNIKINYCPECGTKLENVCKFCPECGKKLF